jgi:hypothetical protein
LSRILRRFAARPVAALALLGVLWSVSGFAQAPCKSDGIFVFPAPGSVIPINSRMILEGVGAEQARVSKLVGKTLVLKAADDTITVTVSNGWKSTVNRVAVILKPGKMMKPDREYSLMIDKPLSGYTILNEGAADTITWRSGRGPDRTPPHFDAKPSVAEGIYRVDGNLVTRKLILLSRLVDESPSYLVVSLRRARGSSAVQSYYVPFNGGQGELGHDGCSGSFAFEDGRAYRAKLELFDSSGNAGVALKPMELHAPRRVSQ